MHGEGKVADTNLSGGDWFRYRGKKYMIFWAEWTGSTAKLGSLYIFSPENNGKPELRKLDMQYPPGVRWETLKPLFVEDPHICGPSPDRKSAIGNVPALAPGTLAPL